MISTHTQLPHPHLDHRDPGEGEQEPQMRMEEEQVNLLFNKKTYLVIGI